MDVHVNLTERRNLAEQIYSQLRDAIVDGRLRLGDALPPGRELATQLEVSRNTVSVAYDRLAAEGFTSGRVGSGTYVTGAAHPSEVKVAAGALGPRAVWAEVPDPPDISGSWRYDFRSGIPDARLFPYQRWRALLARELRVNAVGAGCYADPSGHPGLREAIVRHLGVSRGVRATASEVLVTSGMQQAIDLLARVLLETGSVVAVEDPGYPPPRHLLRSLGATIVGVPVDDEGIIVDAIPPQARMVYVTPSHQYPLGMPLSLARRMALLSWANSRGGVIIEDDYDGEFRYAGRPLQPLYSLDHTGRVCYVGSFSKVMLPTLRIGFLIAPPELRGALRKAKYVTDCHTALATQAALARFIDSGQLAAHIRRMRHVYAERHQVVTDQLRRTLSPWLVPVRSATGLHLTALATALAPAELLTATRRLRAQGVAIAALSAYATGDAPRAGVVLGYGMLTAADAVTGLGLLRTELEAGSG